MERRRQLMVLTAVLLSCLAPAAMVYDSFDYAAGTIIGQGGGGGFDAGSNWVYAGTASSVGTATVIEDSLGFGDWYTAGGALQLTMAESTVFAEVRIRRNVDVDFAAGSDLWVSFLYQQPNAPLASVASRTAQIRAADLNFRMSPKNSGSQGAAIGYDSTVVGNGTKNLQDGRTYLFISRFGDLASATGKKGVMWVFDIDSYNTMLANGGVTEANLNLYKYLFVEDEHANKALNSSSQIEILVADSSNTGFSAVLDELRYGVSLQEVMVPEPATLLLLGLGALTCLRRK